MTDVMAGSSGTWSALVVQDDPDAGSFTRTARSTTRPTAIAELPPGHGPAGEPGRA